MKVYVQEEEIYPVYELTLEPPEWPCALYDNLPEDIVTRYMAAYKEFFSARTALIDALEGAA
jgi:hypothetical protein